MDPLLSSWWLLENRTFPDSSQYFFTLYSQLRPSGPPLLDPAPRGLSISNKILILLFFFNFSQFTNTNLPKFEKIEKVGQSGKFLQGDWKSMKILQI